MREAEPGVAPRRKHLRLVERGQRFYVKLERLIVLAFDLQFGLQLFYEQFEARDFRLQFLNIGSARLRAIGAGNIEIVRWRLGLLRLVMRCRRNLL